MPADLAQTVQLEIQARVESRAVVVDYQLTYHGDGTIGVFDRVPSVATDGTSYLLPNTAYVDPEGHVLHLKKLVLDKPEGLQMVGQIVPGVVILHAGEVLAEQVQLPVPIPANNPNRLAAQVNAAGGKPFHTTAPFEATSVRLSLGVFRYDASEKLIELSPAFPGVYRLWPPGPSVDRQEVVSASAPLVPPVTMLDYAPAAP